MTNIGFKNYTEGVRGWEELGRRGWGLGVRRN